MLENKGRCVRLARRGLESKARSDQTQLKERGSRHHGLKRIPHAWLKGGYQIAGREGDQRLLAQFARLVRRWIWNDEGITRTVADLAWESEAVLSISRQPVVLFRWERKRR